MTNTTTNAFTCFDCWALALALCERYPHLRLHALTGPHGLWVHALAYKPSTDLYVDVAGAHTRDDVQAFWEDNPEWDDLREIPAEKFAGMDRQAPHVSTEEGITAALAAGWTPRP
ncbi:MULTISPECIES: hypothetical protein [Kocuria]|uniref:hypothetical protein n=1 Tax=Kocuria TaxID=57493 RepID=UPI0007EC2669|nr:hypothetical protein [Kocuria sp. ICS0012]OBA50685.1 hypothetical protein A5728_01840 [Kocuria sp. ICS0012]